MLGVRRSTITTWTIEEFKEHFTSTAQGRNQRPRNLTKLDIRLLHVINTMKKENVPAGEIHATLRQMCEVTLLEQRLSQLEDRLEAKDDDILELTRQLAAAETELRLYRTGRLKPDDQ